MSLRLTGGLGCGKGPKVEEFKIESVRDWVVCGSRRRESESLGTP